LNNQKSTVKDQPKETVSDNVTSNIDQERNRIIKRIIAMKDEQGLSFGEIARPVSVKEFVAKNQFNSYRRIRIGGRTA
jgi:hypothetical protein